ncbi:MAG TPA: hypothetical protein VEL28_16050 [Candidatus Binatia bacterium]|nr:hypothetical protein [Candidatus Binatia bacterium]
MNLRNSIALGGAIALTFFAGTASAFEDCPDGVTCTEYKGSGNGGYFRITVPQDWDGDLVIINHGFDLDKSSIRGHETCRQSGTPVPCQQDSDCPTDIICNNISYFGLEELLLPMGKAVAASTYSETGWAVFDSRKDLKEILKFMKKHPDIGRPERTIVTGFSLGGAVTADAILRTKIDGALPLCGAVGGGLQTWDTANEVRLVYDFLCEGVEEGTFNSPPDVGEPTTFNSGNDAIGMAVVVNKCLGVPIGPSEDPVEAAAQADRLADFYEITQFSGTNSEVAIAMGFATLGMGDFVRDADRLGGKRIGWNADPDLDYTTIGENPTLAAIYDAEVQRMTRGPGRGALAKSTLIDFTKGKGKAVDYPILSMAGSADWLVIPEFQKVFTDAAEIGGKLLTQTWVGTYGHCTFTEEETAALFLEYFDWLDSADHVATQPTETDIAARCVSAEVGGIEGDTCNFDLGYAAAELHDRIPARPDWVPAAQPPTP